MPTTSLPLTPALSRRERENRVQRGQGTGACAVSRQSRWWFPLPGGEGQGEGERVTASPVTPGLRRNSRFFSFLSDHKKPIALAVGVMLVGALFRWEVSEIDDGQTGQPIARYRGVVCPGNQAVLQQAAADSSSFMSDTGAATAW